MPTRERVYRSEGVVLRRYDLGEADRILILYTADQGKVRAVAKGVRRPKSRKAGHLEPFTRSRLLLARGRELDIVTQAEAVDLYPDLRRDLEGVGHASYVVELLDAFTIVEGENRALYRLLVETLERLASGASPAFVLRYYELRLLDHVGYRPELFRCVGCGREVRPQDQYFSSAEGGVLCPECAPSRRGLRPLRLSALKVLRHYQRSSYELAASPKVRPEVLADLESLLEDYLTFLLERKLNSPNFLRRVRSMTLGELEPDVSL